MDLTNESYVIWIHTKSGKEKYYRAQAGWRKVSTRHRSFSMTAEQVLNHLLPALAGIKAGLRVVVEHRPGRASIAKAAEGVARSTRRGRTNAD